MKKQQPWGFPPKEVNYSVKKHRRLAKEIFIRANARAELEQDKITWEQALEQARLLLS